MLNAHMKLRLRVSHARKIAEDIVLFDLVAESQNSLPPYLAGAHIDIRTPSGLIRQYSLCGDPRDDGCYRIAVKLEPHSRGGSRSMHESVQTGEGLLASWPKNNFNLNDGRGPAILIAGGIGITPLLSMAYELSSRSRRWELHYFVRAAAQAAFHQQLSGEPFAEHVKIHKGLGVTETLDVIEELVSVQPRDAELYVCGPGAFMNAVNGFAAKSLPKGHVHIEHFGADPNLDVTGQSFELVLARSGGSVFVRAEQTIVDALTASGHPIETSCEQGICGTCVTKVLSGEPDHRDMFLTDEEKRSKKVLMPCVSRSYSARLVLDL